MNSPQIEETYIRSVASVLHSWLNYLYEVSNTKHLAAESSLRFPIAGFLERKDVKLTLEKEHPYFKRKRVDFYWKTRGFDIYMEAKYVRGKNQPICQDIYNDLFRLALIDDGKHRNNITYFLICGNIKDFGKYFGITNQSKAYFEDEGGGIKLHSYKTKVEGNINEILSCDINEDIREFEFHKNNEFYNSFVEKYHSDTNSSPIPQSLKIRTTLMMSYTKELESAVAIWKVERVETTEG